MQNRHVMENGGAIHITVAEWITPSGDSIGEDGIAVDIESSDDPETEDVDEALQRAIEAL